MHVNALATFPETKNAPGKAGGTIILLLAEREERSHDRNELLIIFISMGCDLVFFLVHRIGP
jgi:hypothetical protein